MNVGRNPERVDVRTPARFREARVWSRALSEAEVAAADTRPDDGLVLWLDAVDARETRPGGDGFYFAFGGDFGPTTTPSDENFCQNGVVSADRTPHPAMGEIKKQQQYVDVVPVDLAKGVVEVLNRYDFTTLSEIAVGRFEVRADDRLLAEGTLPALDVAPHATKRFTLPLPALAPEAGVEHWLDLDLRPEGRHAVGEGGARPRARAAPPRTRQARLGARHGGAARAHRDRRHAAGHGREAPTSPTASIPPRASSPRSGRRAWSSWPGRCGPTSGALRTTTTAAAT